MNDERSPGRRTLVRRRTFLSRLLSGLAALPLAARLGSRRLGPDALSAQSQADPRRLRPQEGDVLVYGLGDRKGEPVKAADLELGGEQEICYAMDPESGVVRDGTRLNQVVLLRFEEAELDDETRAISAEGVVAYSAICPHTGCDISMWRSASRNLLCSCHDSEFDPRSLAEVKSGPAPRRLPALPVAVVGGVVRAAGGFDARIRFQRDL